MHALNNTAIGMHYILAKAAMKPVYAKLFAVHRIFGQTEFYSALDQKRYVPCIGIEIMKYKVVFKQNFNKAYLEYLLLEKESI